MVRALLIGLTALLLLYALFVLVLFAVGRREDARAIARLVPDCIVLFARLLRDPLVPRRHKVLLGAVAAYLALPFDLVPDFIPVAGQLDDAIIVTLALRVVVRRDSDRVREHWPGPERSLALLGL